MLLRVNVIMKITVYIQPSSKKSGYAGLYDNKPKIKITAPPVEGAANAEVIQIFARLLSIPKNCIEITSGHTARIKTLNIDTQLSYNEVIALLEQF